jgi:hypothetical protein
MRCNVHKGLFPDGPFPARASIADVLLIDALGHLPEAIDVGQLDRHRLRPRVVVGDAGEGAGMTRGDIFSRPKPSSTSTIASPQFRRRSGRYINTL